MKKITANQARLRVMLSDYEHLGSRAESDVARYGQHSFDYDSARMEIRAAVEKIIGRPIYDPEPMPPEQDSNPGVPF